jgi:hypothetical protein
MAERDETKGHIEDARGRRVALLDPFSLHMLPRHDVIPPEYLGAIAKQIGPGMPRWQYRGYLTCVILFLIGMGLRFDAVERVLWPANIALFLLSGLMTWRGARRARSKRATTVMLQFRRCPHCGYDLRGLREDPADGATVCPECGCAWRLAAETPVDSR